jgi:hypothetical protein
VDGDDAVGPSHIPGDARRSPTTRGPTNLSPPARPPHLPLTPIASNTICHRYVRDALAIGVLLLFTPALLSTAAGLGGAADVSAPGPLGGGATSVGGVDTLARLWLCKALLNCWRCLTALFRIHIQLRPEWSLATAPAGKGGGHSAGRRSGGIAHFGSTGTGAGGARKGRVQRCLEVVVMSRRDWRGTRIP